MGITNRSSKPFKRPKSFTSCYAIKKQKCVEWKGYSNFCYLLKVFVAVLLRKCASCKSFWSWNNPSWKSTNNNYFFFILFSLHSCTLLTILSFSLLWTVLSRLLAIFFTNLYECPLLTNFRLVHLSLFVDRLELWLVLLHSRFRDLLKDRTSRKVFFKKGLFVCIGRFIWVARNSASLFSLNRFASFRISCIANLKKDLTAIYEWFCLFSYLLS